jgi:hypothetical protein
VETLGERILKHVALVRYHSHKLKVIRSSIHLPGKKVYSLLRTPLPTRLQNLGLDVVPDQ